MKLKSILSSLFIVLGSLTIAQSAELNYPGFSGSINTTVTSGFSMRTDRNCLGVRGEEYLQGDTSSLYAATIASEQAAADRSAFLKDGDGCAKRYTDGYGNTGLSTSGARNLISANADNGRTNFDEGDIFDVTQRLYSEIDGTLDSGTRVSLSFVGTYNPLIDIAGNPTFAPFSSDQIDEIESDLNILNAYITHDIDENTSLTAGRFVTNWGESTFIPVGMNGTVTNAIDLSALRVPGSSIKEALIPTEQITLSGYLDGGWSYEAYYQIGESHIEADEEGQFFGSDVLNGDRLIVSGQYSGNDYARSAACGYLAQAPLASGGGAQSCDADAIAYLNTAAGKAKGDQYLYQEGFKKIFSGANASQIALKTGMLGTGAATAWGGAGGEIPVLGTSATAAVVSAMANWDIYDRKQGTKAGAVDNTTLGHQYADGDEQFGFALRTYLDDVGTGVDLGFYYSQYDSKVPYLQFKGSQAFVAGDLLGIFTMATKFAEGEEATLAAYLGDQALAGTDAITLTATEQAGFGQVLLGLANVAYSEAACAAYQKAEAADDIYGLGTSSSLLYSNAEVQLGLQANNYTNIGGKLYHDSMKCYVNAQANAFNTAGTQSAAAALLGAAVTPLNMGQYQFIYPDNLQAMGISANTNIGSTTVQAEVTFRPDFPLATDPGDQGQQMSDAGGTTTLLAHGVAKGFFDKSLHDAVITPAYQAGNANATADFGDVLMDIQNFKRSTLPTISAATVAAGDYYSTAFWEYDVISGTIGTTSTFTASHPATAALGADGTVLLSEIGFVYVPDLTDTKAVARGGYRDGVGGAKCGGITQGAGNPTVFGGAAAAALHGGTHLGSAQTDPIFGNGSYCESKNNIDDLSMTYRLIGSATYNNVNNSPWAFSPSIVWSHDFSGYGPTSLGGFVPGKQSVSLTGNFTNGDVRASINYVNQLGDELDNLGFDQDYVSASVSYAF